MLYVASSPASRNSAARARIVRFQGWTATLTYTVRCASTRAEIWRWYWRARARPKGPWLYHVVISFLSAIGTTALEKQSNFDAGHVSVVFVVTMLGCAVLLPVWPQIRFKPTVRILKIDEEASRRSLDADQAPVLEGCSVRRGIRWHHRHHGHQQQCFHSALAGNRI